MGVFWASDKYREIKCLEMNSMKCHLAIQRINLVIDVVIGRIMAPRGAWVLIYENYEYVMLHARGN